SAPMPAANRTRSSSSPTLRRITTVFNWIRGLVAPAAVRTSTRVRRLSTTRLSTAPGRMAANVSGLAPSMDTWSASSPAARRAAPTGARTDCDLDLGVEVEQVRGVGGAVGRGSRHLLVPGARREEARPTEALHHPKLRGDVLAAVHDGQLHPEGEAAGAAQLC